MGGAILGVDKPYGWTSAQVVEWVKRHLAVRKAGHAGTLDPLATGLVLVATEAATKLISQLQAYEKEYYALLRLGYRTASDDAEFAPEAVGPPPLLSVTERQVLLREFVGELWQRPPAFSALKLQGRRAYQLARKGAIVSLTPRPVQVFQIEEVAYDPPERWLVRLVCGKGFYVRSFARDVGERLGCGAYLAALRRTRIGPYHVLQALQPDGSHLQYGRSPQYGSLPR